MDWHEWYGWHGGIGLWGFIIAIVLIGSVTSYLKQKSRNELMKEALKNGQSIDPNMLKDLNEEDSKGGMILGGAICIAVAAGLIFMGYQFERSGVSDADDNLFEVMKGVAAIPGLVGVVLMIFGIITKLGGRKS